MRGEEPDADVLAELTAPRKLTKAAPVDPVLGLVGPPPARPRLAPTEEEWARHQDALRPTEPTPVTYRKEGGLPVDEPGRPTSAGSVGAELPERKEKVGGWYGYPSNLARIRAAWFHTQTSEDGWPSLSEMTEQLLLREAERLEREHNGGERFPDVPAGQVRHSRRPSS